VWSARHKVVVVITALCGQNSRKRGSTRLNAVLVITDKGVTIAECDQHGTKRSRAFPHGVVKTAASVVSVEYGMRSGRCNYGITVTMTQMTTTQGVLQTLLALSRGLRFRMPHQPNLAPTS